MSGSLATTPHIWPEFVRCQGLPLRSACPPLKAFKGQYIEMALYIEWTFRRDTRHRSSTASTFAQFSLLENSAVSNGAVSADIGTHNIARFAPFRRNHGIGRYAPADRAGRPMQMSATNTCRCLKRKSPSPAALFRGLCRSARKVHHPCPGRSRYGPVGKIEMPWRQ
jgi:hypothetical protein